MGAKTSQVQEKEKLTTKWQEKQTTSTGINDKL